MKRTITALLAATALSVPALAQAQAPGTAVPSMAEQDTGIVLSGTVEEVFGEDGFVLDYGQGTLAVATGDLYEQNPDFRLSAGEDVTVFAQTGEEFFADRIVDADAVFVRSRDDFARIAEPVAMLFFSPSADPGMGTTAGVTGRVRDVEGRFFEMDANGQSIIVDTRGMRYDPLDDIGRQQVRPGNVVVVYGPIDSGFMDGRELRADRITTMSAGRSGMSDRDTRLDDRQDRRSTDDRRMDDRMSERRPQDRDADRFASRDTDGRDGRSDAMRDERMAERRTAERRVDDRDRMASDRDRDERRARAERSRPDTNRAPAQVAGPVESEDFDEFESYDRNGDGVVTLEEYVRVAARPANVTRSEAVRLFSALAKGDRLMTKKEFLNPSSRYERLSERFLSS